jgi:hypothetical protein
MESWIDQTITQPVHTVAGLLSAARQAARAGERPRAYRLSLQATQVEPGNIHAWLMRARTAPSFEEGIFCLSQANELNPNHQEGQRNTFFALERLLQEDPFLAYLDETEHLYHVRNGTYLALSLPKKRSTGEAYPAQQPHPLQPANRWLALAWLGLLLAGIGTLICAPLAAMAALSAGQKRLSRADRVRCTILVATAGGLFVIGSVLCFLFLYHLIG